jgi:NADP-dependent 3-hydroxy acid dehydrogenase YdfG
MTAPLAKTVAFFGATRGVGLSALKHNLAAGNRCVAMCRNPDTLKGLLTQDQLTKLDLRKGDIRDAATVEQCLRTSSGALVDTVVFSVGAAPIISN